jgi:hypothetical protein
MFHDLPRIVVPIKAFDRRTGCASTQSPEPDNAAIFVITKSVVPV